MAGIQTEFYARESAEAERCGNGGTSPFATAEFSLRELALQRRMSSSFGRPDGETGDAMTLLQQGFQPRGQSAIAAGDPAAAAAGDPAAADATSGESGFLLIPDMACWTTGEVRFSVDPRLSPPFLESNPPPSQSPAAVPRLGQDVGSVSFKCAANGDGFIATFHSGSKCDGQSSADETDMAVALEAISSLPSFFDQLDDCQCSSDRSLAQS